MRLQAAQNKCKRFYFKLNEMSSTKSKDFEKINWLPIHERVSQCSLCSVYKFFTKNCSNYFDKTYLPLEINGVHTRSLYKNLILIWVGFLGGSFSGVCVCVCVCVCVYGGGGKIIPPLPFYRVQNSLELCQKLEIWCVSTHAYAVSENIPFSTKPLLILLMPAFFFFLENISIFWQKQYLYSKQQCESCFGDFLVLFSVFV